MRASLPSLRDLEGRLRAWLLGVPVFVKVMGIALGMAVVLGAGMLWQIHEAWHGLLVRDLERRGQALVTEVAGQCVELAQAGRMSEIRQTLERALARTPDLLYLALTERNGVVLAETRVAGRSQAAGGSRR